MSQPLPCASNYKAEMDTLNIFTIGCQVSQRAYSSDGLTKTHEQQQSLTATGIPILRAWPGEVLKARFENPLANSLLATGSFCLEGSL